MKKFVFLSFAVVLAACSSRPTSMEVRELQVDCSRAQYQLEMLDQEMITAGERAAAGVGTVVPSAALLSAFAGRWETNKDISTGQYEDILAAKAAEVRSTCGIF